MGYYTVLCDYLPDNPGQYVADKYYNASTTDVEAVYEIAKAEQVDGILAYASDPAALPAALVADRLGLPTNPPEAVRILGVKHEFRRFLQEQGFACPRFHTFSPSDEIRGVEDAVKGFRFPIVVKPTDSSGSKGVTKLESTFGLEEAIKAAERYSHNKVLIAEEFIHRGFPDVVGGRHLCSRRENRVVRRNDLSEGRTRERTCADRRKISRRPEQGRHRPYP